MTQTPMTTKTFVMYPSLGVGHLNPMVELAKHLRRRGLGVVVAVIDPPDNDAVSADAMARLAVVNPSITFRLLPALATPDVGAHPIKRSHDTLQLANTVLRDFLRSLPAVDALLLDMFCVDALDVAAELAIPAYFFFPSQASALAVFLHLPYYYPNLPSFSEMGKAAHLRFPGMPPIRTVDMLAMLQDKESEATKVRLYQFKRMTEAKGVLVNSFDWLEPKALKALAAGVCVPDKPTPRVYCIGPLVDAGKKGTSGGERHACLAWLDAQPQRSVVFLCFGSMGAFPVAQLKEIARGLESSGHRFLWAVRSPPEEQSASPEPDLERLLPAGFLERTKGRGMVVKNWVPQAEVVQHEAVGAFVTHCGWNSTLEAIMSALPMICWPLYAEQAMNKVFMVEEMKIAVPLDGYEEGGLVKAEEVEAKVRLVMETEEGSKLRERLVETRDMALDAITEAGSSEVAFDEFMRDLEKSSLENGDRS
uniref:Glycosyltransferase n=1 Tax=Oryza punctata TaxID=4537 RepID=A0A0E0L4V8_ORYPU